MYRDVVRDGFLATVYDDGSIGFHGVAPGVTRYGVNERLNEQYRLGKKRGFERYADGQAILNPHYVNVVTSKTATSLDFQAIIGPGTRVMVSGKPRLSESGVPFGSAQWQSSAHPISWFVIKSDLERSHMPQAWYAGKLPLIPDRRFWAWYNAPASVSSDILRFDPPQVMDEAGVRCLKTYLFLILNGWTWGIRPQDATRLMQGLGFHVTNKDVRSAFDSLVADGWARPSCNVPPKRGTTDFWRPCPTALSFRKADSTPIHQWDATNEQVCAAYADLFEAFVPFLKVADADLPRGHRTPDPFPVSPLASWR